MRKTLGIASAALACALAATVSASVESDAKRLAEAGTVLREIHAAPDKDIPQELWEKAQCVAVIPSVKKAAFIIGGEYGKGVVSCRNGGTWSAPSFLELQKGSVGFQIGGESVDLVLLVMNDEGVNRLLESKVALGTEASLAGGPVGRDARAMTNAQLKAQMLSYSRAQGLFAGIDLTGGVLKPDTDENRAFYGRGVSAREILKDHKVAAPASAEAFMTALKRTMPSRSQH
jgi:lipid-binding SYLF domain-containing protein